jgi:hypothetical protein
MSAIRCASCTQPIPDHEPDLIPEDLSTGRQRYYHAFCEGTVFEDILAEPAPYRVVNRRVETEMN